MGGRGASVHVTELEGERGRERPPGGDFHIKVTGVIVGNFVKNPKWYQNSVLWAWSEQSVD